MLLHVPVDSLKLSDKLYHNLHLFYKNQLVIDETRSMHDYGYRMPTFHPVYVIFQK